jgi:hypothetical protein
MNAKEIERYLNMEKIDRNLYMKDGELLSQCVREGRLLKNMTKIVPTALVLKPGNVAPLKVSPGNVDPPKPSPHNVDPPKAKSTKKRVTKA